MSRKASSFITLDQKHTKAQSTSGRESISFMLQLYECAGFDIPTGPSQGIFKTGSCTEDAHTTDRTDLLATIVRTTSRGRDGNRLDGNQIKCFMNRRLIDMLPMDN